MISTKFGSTNIHVGDTVRVHSTVVEGNKRRVQIFEGIVLSISGREENQMFTVRHISSLGIGVERMWPTNSNSLVKIEVKKKASHVRRSKLFFLRRLTGQQASRI